MSGITTTVSIQKKMFYSNTATKSRKRTKSTHVCRSVVRKNAKMDVDISSCKATTYLQLPTTFKLFWRQADALNYARNPARNLCVFAYEAASLGNEGQRRYLAATFSEFAAKYRRVPPSKRHVYEVIPDSTPGRLYFDLEFKRSANPAIKYSRALSILETFVSFVCYQLQVHFNISVCRSNVLDLDSSSDSKFSRHLIFHLPGAAFENNRVTGNFVHSICDQLRLFRQVSGSSKCGETMEDVYLNTFPLSSAHSSTPCPSAQELLQLFVKDSHGELVLICDEAVYTKNRNFRLYLSSKLGCSDRYLRVAKESTFKSSFDCHASTPERVKLANTLMDSLVSYVRFHDDMKILSFGSVTVGSPSQVPKHRSSDPLPAASDGYHHSQFPELDEYILSQWTKEEIVPVIRKWIYFPQDQILQYDVLRSRWCENVQRHHKSNNVYLVVNLQMGFYYQKCYDPECRRIGFKSNEYPLPSAVNPLHAPPVADPAGESTGSEEEGGLESDDFLQDFLLLESSVDEDLYSVSLAEIFEEFSEEEQEKDQTLEQASTDYSFADDDKSDSLFLQALKQFESKEL